MAGPDRYPRAALGYLALGILSAVACSTSSPPPLEAPAGTTMSAPQPVPEQGSATEASSSESDSDETAAAKPETTMAAPELEPPPDVATTAPDTRAAAPEPTSSPDVATTAPDTIAAAPEPASPPDDDSVVTIDTGARDVTERPQTLAEAARGERERRQIAEPTDIVITDKTLAEYATGDLTTVQPSAQEEARRVESSQLEQKQAEQEAYWRGKAREIRQQWRDAHDKIPELEEKIFQLRQAFYREDDGFYRDGEIKPAWDRAIDQLEDARLEVEDRQEELALFLEEGREAGALPGWLREGIDLEPETQVVTDPTAEPGEPVIYQQEATDPP